VHRVFSLSNDLCRDPLADLKIFHDSCSFYRALEIAEADIRETAEE
jgi:hypothetical protein